MTSESSVATVDVVNDQPPPSGKANGGVAVLPLVLDALDAVRHSGYVIDRLRADLIRRVDYKAAQYGETLHTRNGRDALVDGYVESLDSVMYAMQAAEEGAADYSLVRECVLLAMSFRRRIVMRAHRRATEADSLGARMVREDAEVSERERVEQESRGHVENVKRAGVESAWVRR